MNPRPQTVTIKNPGGPEGGKVLDNKASFEALTKALTTSKVLSEKVVYLIEGKKATVTLNEGPQPKDKRVYTVTWV